MVGKKTDKNGIKGREGKVSFQKTTCRNHAPEFLFWSFFFLLLISQNTLLVYPPRVASVEKRPSFPLSIEINPAFERGRREIIELLLTVGIYSRKNSICCYHENINDHLVDRISDIWVMNVRYILARNSNSHSFFRATIGSFQ